MAALSTIVCIVCCEYVCVCALWPALQQHSAHPMAPSMAPPHAQAQPPPPVAIGQCRCQSKPFPRRCRLCLFFLSCLVTLYGDANGNTLQPMYVLIVYWFLKRNFEKSTVSFANKGSQRSIGNMAGFALPREMTDLSKMTLCRNYSRQFSVFQAIWVNYPIIIRAEALRQLGSQDEALTLKKNIQG